MRRGRGGNTITGQDEAKLHRRTRTVIEAALTQPAERRPDGRPLVVVTPHAPHALCLPEAHRTGWAAGNAASDLSVLTDAGRIALWVHGHVHHTVDLVRPGGTRVVCNPAGPGFINPWFREDWVIEA